MAQTGISEEKRRQLFGDEEPDLLEERGERRCSYFWHFRPVAGVRNSQMLERRHAAVGDFAEQMTKLVAIYSSKANETTQDIFSALIHTVRPISAVINGKATVFGSTEEKFNALVEEWRRLSKPGSSVSLLVNDAYGQIVAMGWDVVPLLLREVQRESGHWFTALKWITGTNLVTPQMRGNMRLIREVWVQWGIENGYLGRDSKGTVVSGQPEGSSGRRLRLHK